MRMRKMRLSDLFQPATSEQLRSTSISRIFFVGNLDVVLKVMVINDNENPLRCCHHGHFLDKSLYVVLTPLNLQLQVR